MPDAKKIWVPQPATRLYGAGGNDPETVRDRFVDMYGEGTVQRAELSTCLDLFMLNGIIKPSEFIDVIQRKLYKIDQSRRAAANLDIDRG
jgi:hypothetical protein